jgi:sulfur carrier protein ThiS
MTISVKIAKLPGRVQEFVLADDATISQLLSHAGMSADGYSLQLNGRPAQVGDALDDGDTVLLVQAVKGNQDLVKVAKLPGRVQEVALHDGTVAEALRLAGHDATGYSIQLNGRPAQLTDEVSDGDTILLVQAVKGNQDLVKVAKLPGRVQEIALNHGSTVKDVLEHAAISADGYSIQLNGRPASLTSGVTDGDTILLVQAVKGN